MVDCQVIEASRRRGFRFSLRTLMVLFTLVCVALGLYVKRVRDRYIAIETIKYWGGEVYFAPLPPQPPGTFDARDRLMAIAMRDGKPRPEFPENLPQGGDFWRRMFGRIGKYHGSEVHGIALFVNSFTPEDSTIDFGVLSAIPEVTLLRLGDVNPAEMAKLPRMPRLESLTLWSGQIDDDVLECLRGMPRLRQLQLPQAVLTSQGMAAIGSRKQLASLDLNRSIVEDAGFAHFTTLPLQELSLKQTNTSDAAVPFVAQIKGLRMLNIEYTSITLEGAERLQRELPQCRIVHDYGWLETE